MKIRRFGVSDGRERRPPGQSTVRPRDSAFECSVKFDGHLIPVTQSNKIDVLTETTVRQVGACERGAPDEMHAVHEAIRDCGEEM